MLKLGAIFLIAVMLAACFSPAIAGAQNAGYAKASKAAVNPKFADYMNSQNILRPLLKSTAEATVSNSARNYGLKPYPVSLSHLSGQSLSSTLLSEAESDTIATGPVSATFPTSYDLRSLGKVTDVRDQGDSGSCWAFATYASMESYLLPGEIRNFSENNLKNTHGFDWGPNDGGNGFISTAYLTRWSGPVNETDDPYDQYSTTSPSLPPVKHVQDVYFLPGRADSLDNDNIKSALMTYGAVYVAYYVNSSAPYYNPSTASYYYPGGSSSNHAVGIVGWDDSYSRFNFSTTPPGDGAFIIKNSWNTDWGDQGYFYVSYYDAILGKDSDMFVYTADPLQDYDHVYQHDWYGLTETWGYSTDTAWFATVYTAQGPQVLEAVGFYAIQPDSEYMVRVYRDGTLVQTSSGTLGMPGYRTVQLDSGVRLEQGEEFRIEVRLRTPGYGYPVPVEGKWYGYDSGATANVSESFISSDGIHWEDVTSFSEDGDVCLKAYTSDTGGIFGFSQPAYTAAESDGSAIVTVTRDTGANPASLNYSATPGTTTARDFTPVAGTLNFDTGETSKTFTVPIIDDLLLEGGETVVLTLSGATNYSQIGQSTATLTIADDETAPAMVPAMLAFAASEEDGTVSVIDVANSTVIARLDAGDEPYDVAISPGGAYAYVTDNASGRLWIVDGRSLTRLQSLPVGSQPRAVAVSPDGSLAAVAASGDNTITVVDLHTFTVLRTVSVGTKPEALAFSPNGSLIYTANNASGDASVITVATGEVSTVSAGAGPTGIAVAPDGRVYITNSGSNNITVILANGTASEITLAGHPRDIAVSPDGYYAYVSFPADDRLDVIGLWPDDLVAQVAASSPGSLALSRDGGTLYAAETSGNKITVIQVPDGGVTGAIIAGNKTTGIAFGPAYQAPTIEFSSASYSVNRSDAELTITIKRDGCVDTNLSVDLSVTGGNATAGVDYAALPTTIELQQGASEATFSLTGFNSTATGDRILVLTLTIPDEAQTGSNDTTTISIVEDRMETLTLNLSEGWNLISLPLTVENNEITSIFPDDVRAGIINIWGWNETTQNWVYYCPDSNDYFYQYYPAIISLDTGKGYWVEMNKSASITIQGYVPNYAPSSQVGLVSGWSLVGSTGMSENTPVSLYQNVVNVWGWDETTQNWVYYCPDSNDYFYQYYPAINTIQPGHGYWVEKN